MGGEEVHGVGVLGRVVEGVEADGGEGVCGVEG